MFFQDDIDTLLAQFAAKDKKQQQIIEELCKQPPSKRSAFTLTPHPEKDQLIMLGGEHFNGTEVSVSFFVQLKSFMKKFKENVK